MCLNQQNKFVFNCIYPTGFQLYTLVSQIPRTTPARRDRLPWPWTIMNVLIWHTCTHEQNDPANTSHTEAGHGTRPDAKDTLHTCLALLTHLLPYIQYTNPPHLPTHTGNCFCVCMCVYVCVYVVRVCEGVCVLGQLSRYVDDTYR